MNQPPKQPSQPDTISADHEGEMSPPSLHPSIWVASLADYNNGILHGDWINANQDETAIWQQIQHILDTSPTARHEGAPAEEWAIHDYDDFGPLRLDEHENIHTVAILGRHIAQYGPAYAAWADDIGLDKAASDDAEQTFTGNYLGHYDTKETYVQQAIDDLGLEADLDKAVPAPLRYYVQIDYQALARDLELGGDITFLADPDGGWWGYRA